MTAIAIMGLITWVLGLCVGSFLNVVVYRLPAGLSVAKPTWSFCPTCNATIRWYDNLPVMSWLMLRARCRGCRSAISVQYPLIEAMTGLVFVLVFQLLFVGEARVGLGAPEWPNDLPLLLAWITLAAALVACSGMDLIAYIVDTRVTDAALLTGIVAYALWPRPGFFVPSVDNPFGGACVAAFIASMLMLWLTVRVDPEAAAAERPATIGLYPSGADPAEQPSVDAAKTTPPPAERDSFAAGALATLAICSVSLALLAFDPNSQVPFAASNLAVHAAFLAMFFGIVLASGHHRPADQEIHVAVEQEARASRWVMLRELTWLSPIVLSGVGVWWVLTFFDAAGSAWGTAMNWQVGSFAPLAGAVFAMQGAMVGAAAGWAVRIIFTMVFGREAFATGDIFILAAAGAVTGWDLVLLGFLFSIPLALAGWLLSLVLRRSLMIAFGPWLAIGFLAALWLNRPAADLADELASRFQSVWHDQPQSLVLFGIVLAAGSVFAVVLARMVRGFVQPPYGPPPPQPPRENGPQPPFEDGPQPPLEDRPQPPLEDGPQPPTAARTLE